MSRYTPVPSKVDFPALEHEVLRFWDEERVFARSIEQRRHCPDWVFYDGPPGTNGRPHIGHMLQSALKDLWPRYKTMRGFRVLRRAGWDTHGLPVELKAERELGLTDKSQIPAFGVEKFQDYCRSTVFRFKDEWEDSIRRIGRFLDLEDHYATLTADYIQSDWWVIKQIWDKGLLYRDVKIMPYCARCGTSLSSHEVAQGYQDVTELTLTARFRLKGEASTYLLAWTTTPWTLLGNVALALGPEVDYVFARVGDETLVFARDLLPAVLGERPHQILRTVPGRELGGLDYEPLWDFQAGPDSEGRQPHRTVVDDYVTAAEGTGIVHLALYGEDDFRLIRAYGLPRVQHVDDTGHFVAGTGPWSGRYFKEEGLDVEIVKDLAARGLLHDKARHEHSYPHCYKCENPLLYHAKPSWFIRTTSVRERMLAANRAIGWVPAGIGEGRFGAWLENNVDWAVSRDRYWGSPLPIWSCEEEGGCGHRLCVESLAELERLAGRPLGPDFDPHIPWIDRVPVACPACGRPMRREPYVLDCWFNAGLMPWGQFGYPARPGSAELFASQFPADFICEGLDQTRGWFYTMLAVSTILTGESSFRHVICTGLVGDKDGRKMSKTLGNVIDPMAVFEEFGADAVRWTFFNSHPWNAKRFSEELIRDAVKEIVLPYWNVYAFFATYAAIDGWSPDQGLAAPEAELDRWILSATVRLNERVCAALEAFDVFSASEAIVDHMDELSNWYIRRSRSRFWKSEDDADKHRAYSTLYRCLRDLTQILAPFLPFVTEVVHQRLLRPAEPALPVSVHLCDWPRADEEVRDPVLEREMDLVYHAVKLGRALRAQHQLKTRQPLAKMLVVVGAGEDDHCIRRMAGLIREELNVREIEISRDEHELVEISVKPNFRTLGKRFGPRMKEAAALIEGWGLREIAMLEHGEMLEVLGEQVKWEDLLIQRKEREGLKVITEHGFTIALDTELTPDLLLEGLARELINRVQNLRKESGLAVSDRIELIVRDGPELRAVLDAHGERVARETLALTLRLADKEDQLRDITLNEVRTAIGLRKVEH
ncbi:MAG: isoleucine--tRNA ligase [bacterium]|nr:isoleucine--tRNA ligase [bacterium]